MKTHLKGLIPAAFTPMHEDGSLNLAQVKPLVAHFLADKVSALYICGSTSEGPSLTIEERLAIATAFVDAANEKLPVIVQVGHDSLAEARKLATHAQKIGAFAISAVPPSYYQIGSIEALIACLAEVAAAAPELPFYYYHIPSVTRVNFNIIDILSRAAEQIPTLAGLKYSNYAVFELQACVEFQSKRFDVFFGCDEMLTSGLAGGIQAAVGSHYNFAAPLYHRIIDAFQRGELDEARKLQSLSINLVRTVFRYRGLPAFKAIMKFIGVDCGPTRLPHVALTADELNALKKELAEMGFFEWGRG